MPKNRTCLITLVLLIPSLAQATYCPPQGKPGAWSKQATYLCSRAVKQGFARDIRVYSPDRSKAVHVVNGHCFVEVGKTTLRLSSEESYVSDYPAELSWSPDSSAFYITQSDATSEINGFHTELYRVNEQTVRRMQDIWSMANDRFGKRHECVNEDPNVAGLEWVGRARSSSLPKYLRIAYVRRGNILRATLYPSPIPKSCTNTALQNCSDAWAAFSG